MLELTDPHLPNIRWCYVDEVLYWDDTTDTLGWWPYVPGRFPDLDSTFQREVLWALLRNQ